MNQITFSPSHCAQLSKFQLEVCGDLIWAETGEHRRPGSETWLSERRPLVAESRTTLK